jgi:hypothetical protein
MVVRSQLKKVKVTETDEAGDGEEGPAADALLAALAALSPADLASCRCVHVIGWRRVDDICVCHVF